MEKKIEKMKKEITQRNGMWIALVICLSGLLTLSSTGMLTRHYQDQHIADFMDGFVIGLIIVLDLVAVYHLAKNMSALKDEKKLMRLYNEMYDEREYMIQSCASRKALKISMGILILVALIVSFFSFEAFLGLIGAMIILGFTKKILVVYYSKQEI